jgi:DNA-binding Lrp family transcriptional regulator
MTSCSAAAGSSNAARGYPRHEECMMIDTTDRAIINSLQGGFPVSERPFAEIAGQIGLQESELIERIARLRQKGILSRFGPMYNAEAMGGAFCLCAMEVPKEELDTVVEQVNAHPEVAHNYERDHRLNVWFVLASDETGRIETVRRWIEEETGCEVLAFPKQREFFIGLKVDA